MARPIPWYQAWQHALYGPASFYRRPEGPIGHFTTSTHGDLGSALALAIARLADREGVCRVLDLGCGRGELLTHLRRLRPGFELTGVDVVDRPPDLDPGITWLRSPGGPCLPDEIAGLGEVLVVANEWLDVVPCTIAEADEDGELREMLVDPATGAERPGDLLEDAEAAWCARWWPEHPPGSRVESGLARDLAWADLLARVDSGVVLGIDYGHTAGERPTTGTLTAYRQGTLVDVVPDGSCDLTAHVAVDSLEQDERGTQREALHALGLTGARPDPGLAHCDPTAYLGRLARSGHLATLTEPSGLGGFHWVLRHLDGAADTRPPTG